MAIEAHALPAAKIIYPTSDGQPMAENTRQFRWIVTIQGGVDALFKDDPNVFVAGDLLWYPQEGAPSIRRAPDTMVVFGRPKGDRGAYLQWEEANIAPQVVFEVLSPGNRQAEMARKFQFYSDYGVEEYYIYDPDAGDLVGWLRDDGQLRVIEQMEGWRSPRLGVRFGLEAGDLVITRPDGARFLSYLELEALRAAESQRANQESQRANQEAARANQEAARAEQLAARLRALGVDLEQDG
jgi:Uma2 family endonuclease